MDHTCIILGFGRGKRRITVATASSRGWTREQSVSLRCCESVKNSDTYSFYNSALFVRLFLPCRGDRGLKKPSHFSVDSEDEKSRATFLLID